MLNYRSDHYFSSWIILWFILSLLFKITPPFYTLFTATIIQILNFNFVCINDKNFTSLHKMINICIISFKFLGAVIIYYYYKYDFYKELNIFAVLMTLYIIYKYIIYGVDYKAELSGKITDKPGYYNCINTPLYNIINQYSK